MIENFFIDEINNKKYIKSATDIENNMLSFFKQSVSQFVVQTFGSCLCETK